MRRRKSLTDAIVRRQDWNEGKRKPKRPIYRPPRPQRRRRAPDTQRNVSLIVEGRGYFEGGGREDRRFARRERYRPCDRRTRGSRKGRRGTYRRRGRRRSWPSPPPSWRRASAGPRSPLRTRTASPRTSPPAVPPHARTPGTSASAPPPPISRNSIPNNPSTKQNPKIS